MNQSHHLLFEETGNNVTDSPRRRGSQKWTRKLENYSLNLDEEQTIGTTTIPRRVTLEDQLSPREKARKQQLLPTTANPTIKAKHGTY